MRNLHHPAAAALLWLSFCALLLAHPVGEAGVFKCKDGAGKIHYQDSPCSYGKRPEAFNDSARNITGSDSQSVHQAAAEISGGRRSQLASKADVGAGQSAARSPNPWDADRQQVPGPKCYTSVWKGRTWGCPFKRWETDEEVEIRLAKASRARPRADDPHQMTSPTPAVRELRPDPSGLGIIKDTAGDRYQVDGAGRLINRSTNQFCEQRGAQVVCQ